MKIDLTLEFNRILSLLSSNNLNLILEELEKFEKKYGNELEFKGFGIKVKEWKAFVFAEKGNLIEANQIYEDILKTFIDYQDSNYNTIFVGHLRVLVSLNRTPEAVYEIENYLDKADSNAFNLLNILEIYCQIMEKESRAIPVKYKPIVQQIKLKLGVEPNLNLLSEEIFYLANENRKSNQKYAFILGNAQDLAKDELIHRLKAYIRSEKLNYYKELAKTALNSFKTKPNS